MYFPVSDVAVSPIFLAGVGFLVGLLGCFFGVGGGFLAGPIMFLAGVPMSFVVGTDLAHMTGKSIIASRRHRVRWSRRDRLCKFEPRQVTLKTL